MARMVPFPMLPTESSAERRLYEGFLGQLADDYVVYHSVDWVLGSQTPGAPPIQGEADFLIAHPIDGLLVLEVKGGELTYDPATRRWRHAGRRFGGEGMEALERALGLRVEIRTPLKLQFDEEDRRIVELTNDQSYVLSYVTKRHRAAIVGPAGSGKTILALQVAKRLAATGNRVLLTCFNWRLADYLREQVKGTAGLDVFHFHGLCRDVAEKAGLAGPPEPTEEG